MNITGVSGFGMVVQPGQDKLYVNDLGIGFEHTYGEYHYTEQLAGVRHFSLMPLGQLAESLFGDSAWPSDRVVPQAWVEFEVGDIETATKELESGGLELLVNARKEPWGQVLTRFLSPTGVMVGIVYNPPAEKA